MSDSHDADAAEAAERARLNAEAERVMNESRPTPSQAEVDAIKTGAMGHDDKEDPQNPEMPTLHEQHAMIANARDPQRQNRTAAPDDDRAPYRTRQMTAERTERAPMPAASKDEDKPGKAADDKAKDNKAG